MKNRHTLCLGTLLFALGAQLTAPLHATRHGRIGLRSGDIDLSTTVRTDEGPDPTIRLVAFPEPLTSDQREALDEAVDRVFTYLPDHAYLVRTCPPESCAGEQLAETGRELDRLGAVWTGPYLDTDKISPEVARVDGSSTVRRPVLLHLFPDAPLAAARSRLETIAGRAAVASRAGGRFSRVRLLLSDSEIAAARPAFARDPAVFWIELESRRVLLNDSSIWVGQSGLSGGQATPVFDNGLRGEGQVIAVLDTGLDADSCYFHDPIEGLPPQNCSGGTTVDTDHRKVLAVDFLWSGDCSGGIDADEWDNQGHGTHVAGTVAGDDFSLPGEHNHRDGMAPAAKLVIQDGGYSGGDNCADLPGLGCPVVDLVPIFQQAWDQGARIHTNSWGDEENDPDTGEYTAGSEDADQFMWDNPEFLLLFAAGNNGGVSHTVDSPSTAKSPISVGSTLRGSSADTISSFSSRGPTDDGRIKPDLTAPGSSIVSADNNFDVADANCTDSTKSGTSMATPGVAGLAALVRQYFTDGYYPTGAPVPADELTPSAALVKAMLVNSATEMNNEGTIPNNTQGWGRVLLDEALHFPGDGRNLWIVDDPVGFLNGSGGSSLSFPLLVETGNEPLEVTVAWTDFPSTPAASTNLVNDLDLVVTGPDGTFRGNVFTGGASTTGGSADRLNTLENVLVPNPTPGLWTVSVEAFTVPMGASQPFALVATGTVAACQGPATATATPGSATLLPSGGDDDPYLDNCEAGRIEFSVTNLGGAPATDVSIVSVSSPSHPDTEFAPATWSSASLPACDVDPSAFVDITTAVGLDPGETLTVEVELTNTEIAPDTTTTQFEIGPTELDETLNPELEFDFESDLEGWTVTSGTFTQETDLGGAGGSAGYLQSSAEEPNQCDVVLSPPLHLTAGSTLSLSTHYEIESGPTWYDRANVSIVSDTTALVQPSTGRLYDVPPGSPNGPCGTDGEPGWAGTQESWAESGFSAADLGSADLVGEPVRIRVEYATDPGLHLGGFRFDAVSITDVSDVVSDQQPNQCALGLLFADGFETGDLQRWSSSNP